MKNIITAQIEFYFKGECMTPKVTVDLDELMEKNGSVSDLRHLLATSNNIDKYSYEYEVMEITPVTIFEAEGMVCEHIDDDKSLDVEAFESCWHKDRLQTQLQSIAKKHLNIDDMQSNQTVLQALKDAYLLGQQSQQKNS